MNVRHMSSRAHVSGFRPRTTSDQNTVEKKLSATWCSAKRPLHPTLLHDSTNTCDQPPLKRCKDESTTGTDIKNAADICGCEYPPSQPFGLIPGPCSAVSSVLPPPTQPVTHAADPLSLRFPGWALKTDVILGFKSCGIEEMYPWQRDCLSQFGVLEGTKNLVYTAPTSAGKSLVADLLVIKRVVEERKKAIIVLPYVAIVQEKTKFLKKVLGRVMVGVPTRPGHKPKWRPLNIVSYHSGAKSRIGWRDVDIAICTTEKANAITNAAIEDRSIDKVGIVVFDELHMLDDEHRGFILELLATKLLCLDLPVQIVGMSATLSDLRAVARWLKGQSYECTFRPVPLTEYIVAENEVRTYDGTLTERLKNITTIRECEDKVNNAVVSLARQTVLEQHGVLVFCGSRNQCEKMAQLLVSIMPPAPEDIRKQRTDVIRDLATLSTGSDPALDKTIPHGVAFHHAGLTTEERNIISDAYDKGCIKIICCTPTMAAGVNLPARRVIVIPRLGRDFVSPAMLRQMKGRAGRKGRDTHGESYVCCRKEDLKAVQGLAFADMPKLSSCLANENGGNGLKRALLEIICTGLATSRSAIEYYFTSTLLYHLHPDLPSLSELLHKTLSFLAGVGLVAVEDEGERYRPTRMGSATVAAGFSPDDGVFMHKELSHALKSFNLETDMHIVYYFTPLHAITSLQPLIIDWRLCRKLLESLDEAAFRAAEFIGVNPAFVNRMANGASFKEDSPEAVHRMRVHRRFYISLMLRALINERPVQRVANQFDVSRGFVQSLSTTCRGFASTSATYCKVMGWTGLAVLLEHFSWRLDMGVRDDLMDLAKLPWVKSATARVFHEMGLKTVEAVAAAEIKKVVEALQAAQPKKLKLRKEDGVKFRAKLRERAEVVVRAAKREWEKECMVVLEE